MLSNTFSPGVGDRRDVNPACGIIGRGGISCPSLLYALPVVAEVVGPGVLLGAVRDVDPAPNLFAWR
jgi:hypothetical protein